MYIFGVYECVFSVVAVVWQPALCKGLKTDNRTVTTNRLNWRRPHGIDEAPHLILLWSNNLFCWLTFQFVRLFLLFLFFLRYSHGYTKFYVFLFFLVGNHSFFLIFFLHPWCHNRVSSRLKMRRLLRSPRWQSLPGLRRHGGQMHHGAGHIVLRDETTPLFWKSKRRPFNSYTGADKTLMSQVAVWRSQSHRQEGASIFFLSFFLTRPWKLVSFFLPSCLIHWRL